MSLINDALKRAKAAQNAGQAPQAQGLTLRSAGPAASPRSGPGGVVPIIATLTAIIGLACLWAATRQNLASRAGNPAAQEQSPAPARQSHAVSAQATRPELTARTDQSLDSPQVTAPATNTPPRSTAAPALPVSGDTSTNTSAPADPPPPKPAPLRLQAVIFHPTRPSAMIGGKMLAIGDMVGEFRLLAIGRASATLASAGRTNILTLPE